MSTQHTADLLAKIIHSSAGQAVLNRLDGGQGIDTEDGKAWLDARAALAQAQPLTDERAAFEAWAKSRYLDPTPVDPGTWGDRIFKHDFIEAMWTAWKARAALEAAPQQAQAPESYEQSLCDLECPPDPDMVDRELAKEALQAHVQFPTMLRKMWSGDQVQQWIDENVNKKSKP